MTNTVKIGDWVSFYWNGTIVISEVRYIEAPDLYPYRRILKTNVGSIQEDYILEVRSKNEHS